MLLKFQKCVQVNGDDVFWDKINSSFWPICPFFSLHIQTLDLLLQNVCFLCTVKGRATVELPSIDTSREGSRAESSKFTESRPVSTSSSTSPSKICGIL